MNKRGTILIVTLWILVILTVFALALGQRASLEVKLAGYARDKLRATELAKAAIERVIYEKLNDPEQEVDALSESWSNNEAFKEFTLGDENFSGTITVSYSFDGIGDEEKTILYGMEDEQSKINVNKVKENDISVLINLLTSCKVENAETKAGLILAWCGNNKELTLEEETYYSGLPYELKNGPLKSVSELLLVPGMSAEILYGEDKNEDGKIGEDEEGIAKYLTVFPLDGKGAVNINTASKKVLLALTNNDEDLVGEIIKYRKGDDQEIGTVYDGWFSTTSFDEDDWSELKSLVATNKLAVNSSTYTIHAQAEVNKVKSFITATIKIDRAKPAPITYLFWQKK